MVGYRTHFLYRTPDHLLKKHPWPKEKLRTQFELVAMTNFALSCCFVAKSCSAFSDVAVPVVAAVPVVDVVQPSVAADDVAVAVVEVSVAVDMDGFCFDLMPPHL